MPEGGVVDVDVHVTLPSVDTIVGYLDPTWREYVEETGFQAPPSPVTLYPPNAPTTIDPRWRTPDGPLPGTTPASIVEHVLEPSGADVAILTCYWGVESIRHPDFAAALARAVNDWLIAEWLDADPRFRMSMVVPAQVADEAAAEIDRIGADPRIVQVLLPVRSSKLYGNRQWHPMFEAMERQGLVAGIHYGGNPEGPPTPTGWPAYFIEDHAGITPIYIAQLASMIGEGLFEKFPGLRASFLESGFAWLGPALWRLDKEWKGLRREVPWVQRPPSETIRERIRFSTQPIDAGPPEAFRKALEWIAAEDLLVYASDFPHGHEGDIDGLLAHFAPADHAKIMSGNARAHYAL
jgi:predicted TIM-barrel fold metal-dependent hydrolase